MSMTLAYDGKFLLLGAGQVLHFQRDTTHVTVTPVADPAPTTTTFAVVTATDLVAGAEKLRLGDALQRVADAATPTYDATEFSTAPRIISMVESGLNTIITVDKAFTGAPAATAGSVRRLYRNVGATDGGIGIEADITRAKRKVDQSPFTVSAPITDIDMTLVLPVAEMRANNFALALGSDDPASENAMSMGASPTLDREDRFAVVIPGENGNNKYWVFPRGVSEGGISIRASKTDPSLMELTVVLMPDTTLGTKAMWDMVVAA